MNQVTLVLLGGDLNCFPIIGRGLEHPYFVSIHSVHYDPSNEESDYQRILKITCVGAPHHTLHWDPSAKSGIIGPPMNPYLTTQSVIR